MAPHDDHRHEHDQHEHDQHAHHVHFDTEEAADSAELEAEVLGGFLHEAIGRARSIADADGLDVQRVLDVGCGPGVGTARLAESFPAASVLAVDGSAAMLERAAGRIGRLGLADRVATRQVDLPADFDLLDRAEVVWASMVLHHLGDEQSGLRALRDRLAPGGLLVLTERSGLVRVDPPPGGAVGEDEWRELDDAWDRWFAGMRAALPGARPSSPYDEMLVAAGFEVLVAEELVATLEPPLDEPAQRFARRQLARAVVELQDRLGAGAHAAFATLADDDDALAASRVRATRSLHIARAR